MRVVERTGDLFEAPERAIGHGVNCQGVMGAGIAAEFRRRWPEMYRSYQLACTQGLLWPGSIFPWQRDGIIVMNLATQDNPGANARTRYIVDSVRVAANYLDEMGLYEMAIPRIGCGIGGLYWPSVRMAIRDTRSRSDFTVFVYTPEEN